MKKILLLITFLTAAAPALFAQTTANDAFNPDMNALVQRVAIASNGYILAGGGFTNVSGQPRNRMARIYSSGILDPSFNPDVNGNITAIAPLPTLQKVYIAGTFSMVGGEFRTNFARLNMDGTLDAIFTAPSGPANSIIVLPDGKFILAGNFTMMGSVPRGYISRQNADGTIDNTFNPNANGIIETAVRQPDGKILIGGQFTNVGGQPRSRIARLNADGTLDASFNANAAANATVRAIELQPDGKIIVGGSFTSVNGTLRNRLARLNADGTLDASFNPNMNNIVWALAVQPDGKFIAGGAFTTVGGTSRPALARFNMDGSLDTTFTPSPNTEVYSIAVQSDGKIVFGGFFTSVNGVARNRLARVYRDGTLETEFNPDTVAGFSVRATIALPDDKILIGGQFTSVNGTPRTLVARLNPNGTLDTTFADPQIGNGVVLSIARQTDGKIIAGGVFNTVGGANQASLARFLPNGARDTGFNPVIVGNVHAIAIQRDGKIIIGGSITQINGFVVTKLARLNADGTLDHLFDAEPNGGDVDEILLQTDGKILIRGSFSTVNNQSRPLLARIMDNGQTLDTGFTPTFSNTAPSVTSLTRIFLQQDGKVLVGGNFNNVSGVARQNIVRLDAEGAVDAAFTASANFAVTAFAEESNGRLTVGGQFTTFNGQAFARLVKVNGSTGATATAFSPNLIGTPSNILIQPDGKTMVSGLLSSVGGATRTGIAKILFSDNGSFQDLTLNGGVAVWQGFFVMPQVHRVFFEWSADGVNYTSVGEGTPDAGGTSWQLAGVTNANGWLRARAVYPDASNGQSAVEFVRFIPRRAVATPFDFDGDWKTDVGIFRPSDGSWWYTRSSSTDFRVFRFGVSSDSLAPGDYTGDGKTDIAVFRPSLGEWFVQRSEDNSFFSFPFGTTGDIPAPADYDNDGKTDAAVFRPSNGTWFILNSGGSGTSIVPFGSFEDKPIPADYDGDGRADIAIFRPSDGSWWYLQSSNAQFKVFRFGVGTDKPVQGDWTGDGRADIAVFRPATGEWFIQRSEDNSFYSFPFGQTGDLPAPGDYDGDGRFDASVFRPATGNWFVQRSTAGILITTFGANGDRPIPNSFVP